MPFSTLIYTSITQSPKKYITVIRNKSLRWKIESWRGLGFEELFFVYFLFVKGERIVHALPTHRWVQVTRAGGNGPLFQEEGVILREGREGRMGREVGRFVGEKLQELPSDGFYLYCEVDGKDVQGEKVMFLGMRERVTRNSRGLKWLERFVVRRASRLEKHRNKVWQRWGPSWVQWASIDRGTTLLCCLGLLLQRFRPLVLEPSCLPTF